MEAIRDSLSRESSPYAGVCACGHLLCHIMSMSDSLSVPMSKRKVMS